MEVIAYAALIQIRLYLDCWYQMKILYITKEEIQKVEARVDQLGQKGKHFYREKKRKLLTEQCLFISKSAFSQIKLFTKSTIINTVTVTVAATFTLVTAEATSTTAAAFSWAASLLQLYLQPRQQQPQLRAQVPEDAVPLMAARCFHWKQCSVIVTEGNLFSLLKEYQCIGWGLKTLLNSFCWVHL